MQMQDKIKFGRWEAVFLLVNLICTKIFLFFPRMAVDDAGTAGWIMVIFTSLLAFVLFSILMGLFKKFEGKDILDIAVHAGGKPLKIITGLFMAGISLLTVVVGLREFAEDMKVISLPSSPLSYVMLFFVAGMAVGSFLGMEAIIRLNAIVIPFISVGYIFILMGVIPDMDLDNIFPIFGTGLNDILGMGVFRVSIFFEILTIFIITPFLGKSKKVRSSGYAALGLSSFFLLIGSFAYILTFSYPASKELFLPIYHMARLINIGRFFQRIESVFVFIWAMAALLYLTTIFYFMLYIAAKTAGLKYIRPLILPFAVITFSAVFIPHNLNDVINILTEIVYKIIGLAGFVFYTLILIIANLRKKQKKGVFKN
jgi:spore germination protein (amino acid permease)